MLPVSITGIVLLTKAARPHSLASAAAKKIADKLTGITVTIKTAAGENDKLFGAVTNNDIAMQLSKAGFEIERRDIHIEEPIKVLGQYRVKVKIASGVETEVKVNVERDS